MNQYFRVVPGMMVGYRGPHGRWRKARLLDTGITRIEDDGSATRLGPRLERAGKVFRLPYGEMVLPW